MRKFSILFNLVCALLRFECCHCCLVLKQTAMHEHHRLIPDLYAIKMDEEVS